jgi:uncharacterized protein GlcG (DUF336 family)
MDAMAISFCAMHSKIGPMPSRANYSPASSASQDSSAGAILPRCSIGGKIVGGIGVSGVDSKDDAQIAQAGADAIR